MVRIAVDVAFWAYYIILLLRVVLSWMRFSPRGIMATHIGPLVYALTEPLLRPLRRALRPYQGASPVDFSPMLLILILSVLEALALRVLAAAGL